MTLTAAEPRRAVQPTRPRAPGPRFRLTDPEPRGTRFALGVAVLFHLLVLLGLLIVSPRVRSVFTGELATPDDTLEVLFMVPLEPSADATTGTSSAELADAGDRGRRAPPLPAEDAGEIEPIFQPTTVPTEIPPVGEATGAPGSGGGAGGGTGAAGRLQQRVTEPRLWGSPGIASPLPKTQVDVMRDRVAGRIEELNDSLAAENAAAARARDWTTTDKNGRRWGISPDGIHLGGITLPAPQFVPPSGRRDEIEGRLARDREVADQADRARIRDIFKERARATRERKDRERAEARGE